MLVKLSVIGLYNYDNSILLISNCYNVFLTKYFLDIRKEILYIKYLI